MSSTPVQEVIDPTSEPERLLHRRLRERARAVTAAIEQDAPFAELVHAEADILPDPLEAMADDDDRPLNEFGRPRLGGLAPSIARPTVEAQNFEIKSSTIQMLQNTARFDGKDHEDPNVHIANFLEVCATFKIHNASDDAVRLRLFPFSLHDRAKSWLLSLPSGSITTWDQMAEKFLTKYFPPEKTAKLRARILTFRQDEGESVYEAWERFKDLMNKVPHHGLKKWQQCESFYSGLEISSRQLVDTYAGGDLGAKTPREAYDILEKVAQKTSTQQLSRVKPATRPGELKVDTYTALTAQIEALAAKIDKVQVRPDKSACDVCGGGHIAGDCPKAVMYTSHAEVNYTGSQNPSHNDPYSNSYNPGWKNHPNFGWKSNPSSQNPPGFQQRPPAQLHNQNPQSQYHPGQSSSAPSSSRMEDMMARLLANSEVAEKRSQQYEQRFVQNETEIRNQKASILAIETQVGQIAKILSERQPGSLPSNTETNPNAHVNAVFTRSGGLRPDTPTPTPPVVDEPPAEIPTQVPQRLSPASTARKDPVREYVPKLPYPGRVMKQKVEEQYGKFLGLFKQLHINLPFIEALSQMPKYAKFLKDILTNKRKLEELSHVVLNEECSAILQSKPVPIKRTDPGSFTIPCLIGSLPVTNALADLGASINLMPYKVFKKLDIGEPKATRMSIQLADRSVKYPRGIVENMLVKIDKFVFPVDFVILDMDEDRNVPLILGRPFLATARALIDVCAGKLTLRVDEETVTFDSGRSLQHPTSHGETVYFINSSDSCVTDKIQVNSKPETLDTGNLCRDTSDTFPNDHQESVFQTDLTLVPIPKFSKIFERGESMTEPFVKRPDSEGARGSDIVDTLPRELLSLVNDVHDPP